MTDPPVWVDIRVLDLSDKPSFGCERWETLVSVQVHQEPALRIWAFFRPLYDDLPERHVSRADIDITARMTCGRNCLHFIHQTVRAQSSRARVGVFRSMRSDLVMSCDRGQLHKIIIEVWMQFHWWDNVVSDRGMPREACRSMESTKSGTTGASSRPGPSDVWSLNKSQEGFHFANGQRVL